MLLDKIAVKTKLSRYFSSHASGIYRRARGGNYILRKESEIFLHKCI